MNDASKLRETPETDAVNKEELTEVLADHYWPCYVRMRKHAKSLERQRDELVEALRTVLNPISSTGIIAAQKLLARIEGERK